MIIRLARAAPRAPRGRTPSLHGALRWPALRVGRRPLRDLGRACCRAAPLHRAHGRRVARGAPGTPCPGRRAHPFLRRLPGPACPHDAPMPALNSRRTPVCAPRTPHARVCPRTPHARAAARPVRRRPFAHPQPPGLLEETVGVVGQYAAQEQLRGVEGPCGGRHLPCGQGDSTSAVRTLRRTRSPAAARRATTSPCSTGPSAPELTRSPGPRRYGCRRSPRRTATRGSAEPEGTRAKLKRLGKLGILTEADAGDFARKQ